MTVAELYGITYTKGLIFEKETSAIYDNYVVANTNRVISDCFFHNNMERMFNNKPPLNQIPYITSLEDNLVYEDIFLNHIMPLGLASYLLQDDDMQKYGIMVTDYKNAIIMNQKIVSQEKIDALTNS